MTKPSRTRRRALGTLALLFAVAASQVTIPIGRTATPMTQSYWFAIPANATSGDLSVTLVTDTEAEYRITAPALERAGVVTKDTPRTEALIGTYEVNGSETLGSQGIHITATAPVTVTLISASEGTSGATLIEPVSKLGQKYIAVAYQNDPSLGFPSQFTIVGTAAETAVQINPACAGMGGSPAGTPIDITLDAGQTWQYECQGGGDVTGSTITATKKINVMAGNRCARIAPGNYCDFLLEQMTPVGRWAKSYPLAQIGDTEDDHIRIVTSQPSTTFTSAGITGAPTFLASAPAVVDATMSGNGRISADKPFFVAQILPGPLSDLDHGDPTMFSAQPLSSATKNLRFVSPADFATNRVTLISRNGVAVTLDGNPVAGFTPIPGGTHRTATLDLLPGQHRIRSASPVLAYVYGLEPYVGIGFTASDPGRAVTTITLAVAKTAGKVRASGQVAPARPGAIVTIKLFRKKAGRYRLLETLRRRLSPSSRYAASFDRPSPGACRITSTFGGDSDYLPSSARKSFRC